MLPVASTDEHLGFVNALFTSTSAVCVTGLTVVDTGSAFSSFGQVVILILIQAGGLGIMTMSTKVIVHFTTSHDAFIQRCILDSNAV